jgi:phenylacetate-coenzyme A ligase PaaK-like adenylate-forming protein
MTKADLMTNFDQIITDRTLSLELVEAHLRQLKSDAYLLDSCHVVTSGGSTGQRGVFLYDWDGWIKMGLSSARILPLMGIEPDRNESCVVIGAGEAAHGSAAFVQSFAPWLLHVFSPFVSLSVTQPISEIIDRLNVARPKRVFGFPSILRQLCFAAEEGKLRITPRSIMVGAEPLSLETRAAIERTFNAKVYNFYGCTEASCVGFSCPTTPGLHLSDDLVIVEPVNAEGLPVPAGVASARVLLTNLFNHLMPLIRYELDDSVIPMESIDRCLCGSSFQKIHDVRGRTDDSFRYPDGTFVHPTAFAALSHEPEILEFQVRQSMEGAHILIHATRQFDHREMRDAIRAKLESLGIRRAEVAIEFVEQIPRTRAGKLRQFVRLPQEASLT